LVGAAFAAYEWTQTRYFVGESNGYVAIYQGVPESVGPLGLSTLHEQTDVSLDSLQPFEQERIADSLPAESLEDALDIVDRLRR
jgi:PPM family protein phosphatase